MYRKSSLYSPGEPNAAPHQNQEPAFSCHGRKMIGMRFPSASRAPSAAAAMLSRYALSSAFFGPPGRTARSVSPVVS